MISQVLDQCQAFWLHVLKSLELHSQINKFWEILTIFCFPSCRSVWMPHHCGKCWDCGCSTGLYTLCFSFCTGLQLQVHYYFTFTWFYLWWTFQTICRRGADWFGSFGRPRNTGTKVNKRGMSINQSFSGYFKIKKKVSQRKLKKKLNFYQQLSNQWPLHAIYYKGLLA